jgi:peptidase E
LHGGNADNGSEKNKQFFTEILNGIDKDDVRVLCIYFARPEGRWDESYATDESAFRARAIEIGKDVETMLATYDLDELVDGIAKADVIFINGGYKGHLKSMLLAIGVDRFTQLVEGKTLVGISAGANMLSKYYYSMASGGVREGIGILNIKLLTHSNSKDAAEKVELLADYKEDLPIWQVAEEEYYIAQ